MRSDSAITIRPYAPEDWHDLWKIRQRQLAESGIVIPSSAIPSHPIDAEPGDHEWDYHHMGRIYLRGRGGFWIAWEDDTPVGHVAAQDLGAGVELRRMYVRPEYRRRGIGALLVERLVAHCVARGVRAIELWTSRSGLGRRVYESCGFHEVANPGTGFADVITATRYHPGGDEIRMRLEVAARVPRAETPSH
jgi:GNAT superfamily N-acetyltransferase